PTAPSPLRPAARAYAYRGLPASRFALPWRAAIERPEKSSPMPAVIAAKTPVEYSGIAYHPL
ncbi:MAG: hypothetical protein, partial [Olavius algarvensis Gamma 1 endosymbiont]